MFTESFSTFWVRGIIIFRYICLANKNRFYNFVANYGCVSRNLNDIEQAKRNKLVKVEKICDEDSILNYKSKLNLVAYEDVSSEGCNKLNNLLSKKFDSITLVVGPEGGFEQREIDNLVDNGFEVVSLGKRILRSETAPLFLMSIISYMYECGDVNEKI